MRQEQKNQTRENIKKAALWCFEKKGYGKTQIGDITEKAGVAQGTFYVHFANKEELLEERLREFNENFIQKVIPLQKKEKGKSFSQRVQKFAKIFLNYWEENRGFIQAYGEKAALGASFENLRDGINPPAFYFLSHLLQEIAGEMKVKIPQAELVAHGLLALWMRLGLQALFNESLSRKEIEKTLVKMTMGSLREFIPDLDLWQSGQKEEQ